MRNELALLLRASALEERVSATRLARSWAYSFCNKQISRLIGESGSLRGSKTYGLILDLLSLAALERNAVALVLETLGGDQSLDTGSLGVRLLALALGLNLTSDNVLADLLGVEGKPKHISHPVFPCFKCGFFPLRLYIGGYAAKDSSLSSRRSNDRVGDDEYCRSTYIVILAEAEEAANLGGALGTEALGVDDVGQAGDLVVALLGDGEGEDSEVHANDATADGLSLALAGAAGSVARVAFGE